MPNEKDSVSISELLRSTENVKGYGYNRTFSEKKFGAIYTFNKIINPKPNRSIIEVTMMIKGATETVRTKRKGDKPVAAHKVMAAISGVEQEIITKEELINRLKKTIPEFNDSSKYNNQDILAYALNPNNKPFKGKTIMETTQRTHIVLITDQIKDSAKIRVWCSCSSYYWVFEYYNQQNGANLTRSGRQINRGTYKYKTEAGQRDFDRGQPMRNPGKHFGVCKHLMLLIAMLMDKRTVSTTSLIAKRVTSNYNINIKRFKEVQRLTKSEYQNLLKSFESDRKLVLAERRENFSSGLASIARSQRRN